MDEKDFLDNYLWPSDDKLDRRFTFPLPPIPGLKKCGDFIVQCRHEDTFSTNIITKYENDALGITVKELYKNTQNEVTGVFVRLVGGMNVVKNGYPRYSLDAPILNVNSATGEREDVKTRMSITLPQADARQREIFFGHLSEQAMAAGISVTSRQVDNAPAFWGPSLIAESKGVNLDMFRKLRDYAWSAYERVIGETKAVIPFDYRPLQEHMVFTVSKREHLMFKKMGMSVPIEAQAAFFNVLVPTS